MYRDFFSSQLLLYRYKIQRGCYPSYYCESTSSNAHRHWEVITLTHTHAPFACRIVILYPVSRLIGIENELMSSILSLSK